MLSSRTRIYTSDTLLDGFPGRVFAVEDSCLLNARDAKRMIPEGKANVLSRNSGLSSEALKRKLKLKDGGGIHAIGVSLQDGKRRLFRCRRIG